CDWPILQELAGVSHNAMILSMSPLPMLAVTDDPVQQLLTAREFGRRKFPFDEGALYRKANPSSLNRKARKLKIGYVSGDLCTHAVGLLLPDFLEAHDKDRVEVYLYDYSPEDGTPTRQRILAAADQAVAKEAWKLFTKQGLAIQLGAKVDSVVIEGKGKARQVVMHYNDPEGKAKTLEVDRLIVSVGRQPLTDGLGLESVGLATDQRGFIPVDAHCATAIEGIFAIGDVVRGPMLAHKAEDEGVMVAEILAGQKPHIDYQCIPWVIYTSPEIAWVGRTEQELQREGRAFKSGQFPFAANGRALGMDATDGFVKMLCDRDTDEILGVHIVAAAASDLIAEAALAMEFKASAEDVARVCHPHPSLSEVMREAALAATDNRALNF
ncbi:MAG: hypothetical protein EBU79_08880, partial [Betaproteobacteria bacterium]|nr:hypothetical protein [Betaproteobacteria bacterium]